MAAGPRLLRSKLHYVRLQSLLNFFEPRSRLAAFHIRPILFCFFQTKNVPVHVSFRFLAPAGIFIPAPVSLVLPQLAMQTERSATEASEGPTGMQITNTKLQARAYAMQTKDQPAKCKPQSQSSCLERRQCRGRIDTAIWNSTTVQSQPFTRTK